MQSNDGHSEGPALAGQVAQDGGHVADRRAAHAARQVAEGAGQVADWRVAHAALTSLAANKAGYDADEARWLVAGKATSVHIGCGYGSYLEYLERVFGYGPRMARERIRVAEALVRLPQMMAALAAGALPWSAVREVTRVATAETESDWVTATSGKTLREVEVVVSGRVPGDRPADMPRPEERTHVLRLELNDCGRRWQEGGGQVIEVDEVALEVADCDGQFIGMTHVGHPERAAQSIPPAVRRLAIRRAHGRCEVPGCRHSGFVDVHHIRFRCDGGSHNLENLVVQCSVHHDHVHAGRMVIAGHLPALRFFHADGRPYGAAPIAAPSPGPHQPVQPDADPLGTANAPHAGSDEAAPVSQAAAYVTVAGASSDVSLMADAVSALTAAGFRVREARAAVTAAAGMLEGTFTLDSLIRAALRQAAPSTHCREAWPSWEAGSLAGL